MLLRAHGFILHEAIYRGMDQHLIDLGVKDVGLYVGKRLG
ncbi:Uncharacterised protein [Sphingobacterium daejeonense]|nr:Uncharacterised protein [Sphingobacterium daejeonense]